MDLSTIDIRSLATYEELTACVALQQATWGEGFSDIVPAAILKVAQRIGGVVVGAFGPDNQLLGFVFGLTGVEKGKIVHWSDMLAVRPEARNLGLGRVLKERQRQMVREVGASVVYWTYDPLIARNAHLNFNRLGVGVAEYVEDMYGVTDSVLHGGIPTDRLIVAWPTGDEEIAARVGQADRALQSDACRTAPVVTVEWIERSAGASSVAPCVRVEVPRDAERLFTTDPKGAASWRARVRRGLQWALASGYSVAAFSTPPDDSSGYYLLTKSAG
jgi:predicted GNAT superfamily acetyltransferase